MRLVPPNPNRRTGCGTINRPCQLACKCKQGVGQLNIGHELPVVKKPGVRFWRLIPTFAAKEPDLDDCSAPAVRHQEEDSADYAASASWREPAGSRPEQPVGFGAMVGVSSGAGKERPQHEVFAVFQDECVARPTLTQFVNCRILREGVPLLDGRRKRANPRNYRSRHPSSSAK